MDVNFYLKILNIIRLFQWHMFLSIQPFSRQHVLRLAACSCAIIAATCRSGRHTTDLRIVLFSSFSSPPNCHFPARRAPSKTSRTSKSNGPPCTWVQTRKLCEVVVWRDVTQQIIHRSRIIMNKVLSIRVMY